jgi:hypothetical protein
MVSTMILQGRADAVRLMSSRAAREVEDTRKLQSEAVRHKNKEGDKEKNLHLTRKEYTR